MKASNHKIRTAMMGLLMISAFAGLGCSNQWRNADLEMDASQVIKVLSEIEADAEISSSNDAAKDNFFALKNNEGSSIYFADAHDWGGPLGPIISVFSVYDYSFVHDDLAGFGDLDIKDVEIAYLELDDQCGLMINVVMPDDSKRTRFFACDSIESGNGYYTATLTASISGQQIVLRSYDADKSGYLKPVIQFQVGLIVNGEELSNGKFSTLVGFTP